VGEKKKNRTDHIIALYQLYKSRRFCSSTPTLFNSGTNHSQLSSCYLYKVDDSIESIMMRGIAENAFLSKWAGGLGGSWTSVRGTGGYIKGTNGESQGVIPFLKLHNDQLIAVNQGGKRRGSGCAYLETWHNDIEDFLKLRINTGDELRRTHDLNTANWVPDLFMRRVDYSEYGGAPLLGVAGITIVGHGRSSAKAVRNAVAMAYRFASGQFIRRVEQEIAAATVSQQ